MLSSWEEWIYYGGSLPRKALSLMLESGVKERWEPLTHFLSWTELGQAGGGAGPDCYSDQPAISGSGGGNTIWECFLDDSATHSLRWSPVETLHAGATVTLPAHSDVLVCTCLAGALSVRRLAGQIRLSDSWPDNQDRRLCPNTDDTWKALAAALQTLPWLSLQAEKTFFLRN